MGLWRKTSKTTQDGFGLGGLAEAALSGANSYQLCGELYGQLAETLREHHVERFAVWLAPEAEGEEPGTNELWEGRCWDQGSDDVPAEWNAIGHGLVPRELLDGSSSVETEAAAEQAVFAPGPTAGMRRVLWVPVRIAGELRGLVLAAAGKTQATLPRLAVERAARELALAVGFRAAALSSQITSQELAFAKEFLTDVMHGSSLDALMQRIASRALGRDRGHQPIALFVIVGILPGHVFSLQPRDAPMEFRWSSGDRLLARVAMGEGTLSAWKEAIERAKTIGKESLLPGSHQEPCHVIAVPLLVDGAPAGVLAAGFRKRRATLANVERLERHALLISLALTLFARNESSVGALESARFFLQHAVEPSFLLNTGLEIIEVSDSGRELLSLPAQETQTSTSARYGIAAHLFRSTERHRLVSWMGEISQKSPVGTSHSLETELRTGRRVRLQAASLPRGGLSLLVQRADRRDLFRQASRTELQAVIDWLEEGILIYDENDHVRAANLRFSRLFGFAASDMEGRPGLHDLIGAIAPRVAEPKRFAESWWNAARDAEISAHEEFEVIQPVPRRLERISRPIVDAGGSRRGRLEIYRDLTAEQLFQSRLRKNERLISLGEKVSGVAHELSNPLTTILGYAQRMLGKSDLRSRREDIEHIFSEAERASAILQQLLGSTREPAPEFHPVALNSLIQRTVELHRFQLASDKIRVELDLAPELPSLRGNAGQLQQILSNLIANSRHALAEIKQPRTILFRTRVSESGRILVEVSDSGPGIPEALRHRIFDPFFTTKPAGVGTGLGLSIVAGLVRQHSGHIRLIQTKTSSGATFLLDFPASPADAPLLLAEPASSRAPELTKRAGECVLVIEDEPTVGQLIADMLSDLGYTADVQHDARRALIQALSQNYALVVCDMKMPGLDGQHLYRALAEAGSALTSRFLFVTGDVLGAATQEFLKHHCLPHIAKPFRVEEFTEKVALVLAEPAGVTTTSASAARI